MKASAIYKASGKALAVWLVMADEQRAAWIAWSGSVMTRSALEEAVAKSREAAEAIKNGSWPRVTHKVEYDDFAKHVLGPKLGSALLVHSPIAQHASSYAARMEAARARDEMVERINGTGPVRGDVKLICGVDLGLREDHAVGTIMVPVHPSMDEFFRRLCKRARKADNRQRRQARRRRRGWT